MTSITDRNYVILNLRRRAAASGSLYMELDSARRPSYLVGRGSARVYRAQTVTVHRSRQGPVLAGSACGLLNPRRPSAAVRICPTYSSCTVVYTVALFRRPRSDVCRSRRSPRSGSNRSAGGLNGNKQSWTLPMHPSTVSRPRALTTALPCRRSVGRSVGRPRRRRSSLSPSGTTQTALIL